MPALGELIGTVAEDASLSSPLGIGLVAVAAVAVVGRQHVRPLAKNALKTYLSVSQRTQVWAAEAVEQWHDLYAEAQHKYVQERDEAAAAAPPDQRPRPQRRAEPVPS